MRDEIPLPKQTTDGERARAWVVLDLDPKKRGSLEQGLVALAARLQHLRVTATVVLAAAPPDWLRAALDERGIDIRVLDFRKPTLAILQFGRWLSVARPHLVHFHFIRAHSPLVLIAHAAGARVVVHDHITLGQPVAAGFEHGTTTKKLLRPLKRLRSATLGRFVDSRIAVSLFVAASVMDAEHFPSARIEVVPNGVDVTRFLKADPMALRWELKIGTRPVVGCVSRMAPEKGVDVLIRAVAAIGNDTALLIAGDGPDIDRCRRLARELGVVDRVHFLGLRDDVENVYAAADVVVMPSLWDEAFGLCVVEAMAAGKPVIVTDSGAMPELIGDGECGAVVAKGDPSALARAISALLDDPARAQSLGQAARQRALSVYPIERWVDGVIAAYGRLVPALKVSSKLISFAPPAAAAPRPEPQDTLVPNEALASRTSSA